MVGVGMATEPTFTIHPEPLEVYVRVTDTVFMFNGNPPYPSNTSERDREVVRVLLQDAIDKLDGL